MLKGDSSGAHRAPAASSVPIGLWWAALLLLPLLAFVLFPKPLPSSAPDALAIRSFMAKSPPDRLTVYLKNVMYLDVTVHWISYEGIEKQDCVLRPGDECKISTFVGHVFSVRDARDNSLVRHLRTTNLIRDTEGVESVVAYTLPDPELESYSNASKWLNVWPREKPSLFMHSVNSPPPGSVALQTAARAFYVPDFFSRRECEDILKTARSYGKSKVTLSLHSNPAVNSLVLKAIGYLKIKPELSLNKILEPVEVMIHNQQQISSRDWIDPYRPSAPNSVQNGNNRLISVIVHLNNAASDTALRGKEGLAKRCGEQGVRVKADQGSAVILYNMLEDGNLDAFADYESCEPLAIDRDTEKWIAKVWFWDPQL